MSATRRRGSFRGMPIAILHGQVPPDAPRDEQDVLVELGVVVQALARLGCRPAAVPCTLDLERVRSELLRLRPELAFNLVESLDGRGQLIHLAPALLDSMDLPYTGAPTEAVFTTSNKLLAKRLLAGAGIATPAWVGAGQPGIAHLDAAPAWIVKSVWEHASIGIGPDSIVSDSRALGTVLAQRRQRYGGQWFAEAYVEGRELNVSLLAGACGPEVLPLAEIDFVGYADRPKIVDYRAKWDPESYEFHHTPRSFDFGADDGPLLDRLRGMALACWELFGLRGYARVDFRVDAQGTPWVLEVNTNPCLAPDAGFIAATERASLSADEVVLRILADASPP
jgi:D-alanine-D-alanine ligase